MRLPHPIVLALVAFIASQVGLGTVLFAHECSDGWPSGSIGRRGACSHHGGVSRGPDFLRNILSIGIGWAAYAGTAKLRQPPQPSAPIPKPAVEPLPAPVKEQATANAGPTCPKCGRHMVLRTARNGAHAGQEFYGCSRYPRCKGTRSTTGRVFRH